MSTSSPAIEIADVSKRFRLYHEKYTSLKERAMHLGRRAPYDNFWALQDINLEIREGQTVGLLGHNGSGKSTLLKCIAGILQPTTGQIRVRGRLAALLELGAGFQPELSGRDNVFLNASLLGMSKRDIAGRFDDIVAFAELEQFIDNQVKYYSSGMYVRLGFAVAVNVEPDILLVDEVLAVGDENFQRKCIERVKQFQREGRTIVFVTHSPDLIRQTCEWGAVLDEGRQVAVGPPGDAIRAFREHLLARQRHAEARQLGLEPDEPEQVASDQDLPGAGAGDQDVEDLPIAAPLGQEDRRNLKVRIESVSIEHPGQDERSALVPNEPLQIHVLYRATSEVEDVVFGIAVHDLEGRLIFGSNTSLLGQHVTAHAGGGEVVFSFDRVPLLDGTFLVSLGIHSRDEGTVYDWQEQRHRFGVLNPGRSTGLVDLGLKIESA